METLRTCVILTNTRQAPTAWRARTCLIGIVDGDDRASEPGEHVPVAKACAMKLLLETCVLGVMVNWHVYLRAICSGTIQYTTS